jgi:hypothetical protein
MGLESVAVDQGDRASNIATFTRHIMALRVPTPKGREWITMDSTKLIPTEVMGAADFIVDVRARNIIRGPHNKEELNTYHQYDSFDDFALSLVQQRAICSQQATELIRFDH